MTGRTVLGGAVAALVAAAVAAGLVMMGSPADARARRLDARRVADLGQLARDVDLFWSRQGALPASLAELSTEPGLDASRSDPETGAPYSYRVIDEARYEVCAGFATETAGEPPRPADRFWAHGRGMQCFEVRAETAEREPRQPGRPSATGRGR